MEIGAGVEVGSVVGLALFPETVQCLDNLREILLSIRDCLKGCEYINVNIRID